MMTFMKIMIKHNYDSYDYDEDDHDDNYDSCHNHSSYYFYTFYTLSFNYKEKNDPIYNIISK